MALGSYRLRLELPKPVTLKAAVWNVTARTFLDKWLGFGVKYCYLIEDRISCNHSYTSFYVLQCSDPPPKKMYEWHRGSERK